MQIESKPLHKFGKVLTKFWTAFINSRESRKFIYISIAIECASSLKHSENLSQHIEKTWFSYWIWIAERQIRQKLFEIATYFCPSTKCCVNEKFWIFKESVIKLQQRLFSLYRTSSRKISWKVFHTRMHAEWKMSSARRNKKKKKSLFNFKKEFSGHLYSSICENSIRGPDVFSFHRHFSALFGCAVCVA